MESNMDKQRKPKPEDRAETKPDNQHPAGPHARPDLTDYEKTPGTGSLPDDTDAEADVGSE
jgi:hypothetical protein